MATRLGPAGHHRHDHLESGLIFYLAAMQHTPPELKEASQLIAFLLFQRQFVQAFMYAGIK